MTEDESGTRRRKGLRTARLEAFSDGVFAIAITLLVLDIGVSASSEHDLLKALADQWPSYLAYVVSFATIGGIWIKHSVITEYLAAVNSVLVRLNLLLLMVVSFLPFPTRLVADYIEEEAAERVAVTVYGINLMMASVLIAGLWWYASQKQLIRPDATDREVAALNKQLIPGVAGYIAMLALGLVRPVLAVFGYLALAAYIIIPFDAIRRRHVAR